MFGFLSVVPELLKGVFGLGLKALDYYTAKANGDVQLGMALMEADRARLTAQRDFILSAMNHPIFWIGWFLFVFPLGVYWNKVIIYDKVLKLGRTDPLEGFVLDWAGYIVLSIFGLQVTAGFAAGIVKRIAGR